MKIANSFGHLIVKATKVAGFIAKVVLLFTTDKPDTVNQSYYFTVTATGQQPLKLPEYYWINNVPDNLVSTLEHRSMLQNLEIPISISLINGDLIKNRYTKEIEIKLIRSLDDIPVWYSGKLTLFTKELDIPQMSAINKIDYTGIHSTINLVWEKDADFNFNSRAFKLESEIRSYLTGNLISRIVQSIEDTNIAHFTGVDEHGAYTINHYLKSFKGDTLDSAQEIITNIERSLDIYIKGKNEVLVPTRVYIKVASDTIKRVISYKVKT